MAKALFDMMRGNMKEFLQLPIEDKVVGRAIQAMTKLHRKPVVYGISG